MSFKVLVVDDEKPIADIIKFNLEKEGYQVSVANDGREALQRAEEDRPDLVILDIMLPRMDGFAVCQEIRRRSHVPILMLTAKQEEVDKVFGLELGADDYVTKPFSPRELVARVKAILRRASSPGGQGPRVIKSGDLIVDLDTYQVRKGEQAVPLSQKEFQLLRFLAAHPGQIFTREALLDEVWGYQYFGDTRTVDVTVRRLREKIEDDPSEPEYVQTKRGVGYYFKRG
ncbi:MAG: response regulator [Bacillota bacterium]